MIRYEVPPIRPPTETYSMLIRATRGCPWNRCVFCNAYKGRKFELRPVEEIKEDILSMKRIEDEIREYAQKTGYGDMLREVAMVNGIPWIEDDGVKTAFLGDSNSLIMRTPELVEVVEFLRQTFPTLERVTSYARAKTVRHKKMEELEEIRRAGLARLHVGLETGDDEILKYMNKGATAEEMIEAGRKAIEAGFELSEYVMPGLGGADRWEQHVEGTARVLNAINPHFIRLRSLWVIKGTPLYEKKEQGEFQVQSVEGLLMETRRLVEELDVASQLVVDDFSTNYYISGGDGKLPEDKGNILDNIDASLEYFRSRAEVESQR